MLAVLELVPASVSQQISIPVAEKHLLLLIYQANRLGSVREVLNRLRHNAFIVRDRFTADTWRIFNRLQLDARVRPGRIPVTESLALLNTLIVDLSAFNGMAMENMTRGHGWLSRHWPARRTRPSVARRPAGGLAGGSRRTTPFGADPGNRRQRDDLSPQLLRAAPT